MVPEGRLELPQAQSPADFESAASTIPPLRRRNYFVVALAICQPHDFLKNNLFEKGLFPQKFLKRAIALEGDR